MFYTMSGPWYQAIKSDQLLITTGIGYRWHNIRHSTFPNGAKILGDPARKQTVKNARSNQNVYRV
jgi:hypothetical protein